VVLVSEACDTPMHDVGSSHGDRRTRGKEPDPSRVVLRTTLRPGVTGFVHRMWTTVWTMRTRP